MLLKRLKTIWFFYPLLWMIQYHGVDAQRSLFFPFLSPFGHTGLILPEKKKTFLVYIFYLPFISRKFVWIRVFNINSVPCFGFFVGNFFYTLIGSSLPIFCITSALICFIYLSISFWFKQFFISFPSSISRKEFSVVFIHSCVPSHQVLISNILFYFYLFSQFR